VKLTKSQLKELIKQAIVEDIFDKEIKNPKTGNMVKVRTALQLPDEHPANKKAKDMVAKTSIDKGDVGGPSYPNVKKGVKTSKQAKGVFDKPKDTKKDNKQPFGKFMGHENSSFGKEAKKTHDKIGEFLDDNKGNIPKEDIDKLRDLQKKAYDVGQTIYKREGSAPLGTADLVRAIEYQTVKAMDDIEQRGIEGEFDESIKESKKRRFTVKEVRMWMKKLEENRYKKVYNSDARRVAWMVNNEGRTLDEMPMSMKKKWSKAQYGRERYLATEFLKSKSEQLSEGLDIRKLENAIMLYKKAIKKQGNVTNARDEEHLKQLIKVYKQMGGKKIKEQMNESIFDAHALMNKKIKNAKTGNMITIRSAVQLPDGHPTKKKARRILNKAFHGEEKLSEAITGADRKILFILVRDIVRNLKSKIKNFDVNNKSHLNRVGSSILAIIRAMTYSPDNVNYKNFKKYFPKNFNSKLIQKKLKQFHSQNDKVQVTLVTQAIKNELGAGVNESKLREQIRGIIKEQLNEAPFKKLGKELILPNDMKTKVKVSKIIKKLKLKIDKDYDVRALDAGGKKQEISVLKKHYDKFLELLMQNKIKVRG
jgi:hypothetical protein